MSSGGKGAPAAAKQERWVRPVAQGAMAAYDHALAYLTADREAKLARLARMRQDGQATEEELESLETSAWVNDPETRWLAANGKGVPLSSSL